MLNQKSSEFNEYFLLSFTEEILKNLIKTSTKFPVQFIKNPQENRFYNPIKTNQKQPLKKIQFQTSPVGQLQKSEFQKSQFKKSTKPIFKKIKPLFKRKPIQRGNLNIPEPRLPEHLQYIRPIPEEALIELGKIIPLIKDPAIRIIECDGPDEKIIVKGAIGVKPTAIILREDEIKEIIEEFSKKSKIPVHDGIYRVAVGRLVLSAIVSTVIPPKFIIEKMKYPQQIEQGFPVNRDNNAR